MKIQNELVVNYIKTGRFLALVVISCMIAILAYFFFVINIKTFVIKSTFNFFITILIKSLLGIGILILIPGFISALLLLRTTTPMLILNKNGIWANHFGPVDWNNITTMEIYTVPGIKTITPIGIRVKNVSRIISNADWQGLIILFWSKLLGPFSAAYRYHIQITGGDISPDEIMAFAKPYLIFEKTEATKTKPTKLIADYNRTGKKYAPFIILFLAGMLAIVLYIDPRLKTLNNSLLTGIIISLLIKNLIILLRSPQPQAILDKNGIWINHFGFIDWNNIAIIEQLFQPPFGRIPIGIRVKNIKLLHQQTDWIGALRLFYARTFGSYHISIQNTAISEYDIIEFAELYVKQKGNP